MKIALVTSILPPTNYSWYLAKALQDEALNVVVYADKNPDNLSAGLENVNLVWSENPLFIPQIIFQCLKDKPDVVHLQHEIRMFGGPITAALFPFLPMILKILGFKIVTTIHAVVPQKEIDLDFLETFSMPRSKLLIFPVKLNFKWIMTMTCWLSDKIWVHAQRIKKILVDEYHTQPDKIVIIPHGVPDEVPLDLEKPDPDLVRHWNLDQTSFVLYFGYLHRRKGVEYLIGAWSKIKNRDNSFDNAKLVISGDTLQKDYKQELLGLVKQNNLDEDVIFTGFVKQAELNWLINQALFLVIPAIYAISASGPMAQAITRHKPLIVTKLGVYEEEIVDGETGLFCQPKNADDMADKIKLLLTDVSLREKLSQGMIKKHEERRWSIIARQAINVYQNLE